MTDTSANRIIHATLGLIAERGVGGVTMSDVAREAGVARQTLYNHYPDIESIVYSAMEAHQRESLEQLTELMRTVGSPAGRLEHLLRHTAAVAAHSHPSFKHGFSSAYRELIAEYDREVRSLIEGALQDGIRDGIFRVNIDPAADAVLLHGIIEATGELVADNPENASGIVTTASNTVFAAVLSAGV